MANCYNPLVEGASTCSHCGLAVAEVGLVERVPRDVLVMIKTKHGREARIVRSIAYGGLLLAMIGASAGLIFISGNWGIAAFIVILIGGYFVSALLANSLGDAWGYRYGQKGLDEDWQTFLAQRAAEPVEPIGHGERANA
ncbi:MAG: hypothetical protein GEU28_12600 [Dehalococcoidia bacterium]|nr:hypothetical protein [Dehalococcoidia bacterium]